MILLEDVHPALLNALERMIRQENVVPHTSVKDFDGTELRITIARSGEVLQTQQTAEQEADEQRNVTVVMSLHHFVPKSVLDVFQNYEAWIRRKFPAASQLVFDDSKSTLTLTIPPKTSDAVRSDLASRFSQLRAWSFVPLFQRQFELFLGGKPEAVKPIRIPYHPNESMYVYTSRGNFICLVSLVVDSADEQVFAKQFLQTFQDAKKLQKEIAQAPGFVFTQQLAPTDMPANLRAEAETEGIFWCQFQLQKSHMEGKEDMVIRVITQLINFRNYLLYHIHCCRSYMHALMRKRVESSLLVLNRSKTNTTGRARVVIK